MNVDHVHLACRDLARSERFYVRLGGTVTARYNWNGIDTVALALGETRINLRTITESDRRPGIDHLGIAVPDIAEEYRALAAEGVDVVREPKPWRPDQVHHDRGDIPLTGTFAFLRGPDGELVELIQRPEDDA